MSDERIEIEIPETTSFVSTRNACKLCSPLGACIAMRGIEGCIPLIHGSQGCSTYIRRYGISHFREPIDIASSNFVEAAAIFGGRENLFRALDNVTKQYQPAAIGITSTCLSETIGDNVPMYLHEYQINRTKLPVIFYASTPSYRGTHLDGYHEAVYAAIESMTGKNIVPKKTRRINLISGFVSASDLRELHEILVSYKIPYTLLPDYSESLDGGAWEEYQKLPEGGTLINDIAAMPEALGTVYLAPSVPQHRNGAVFLRDRFGVPATNINLPIGVENTDKFFATLNQLTEQKTPAVWEKHRGRLIDAYFDGHKYCSGKRAVLYGDIDFVTAMKLFLEEIGVIPVLAADGAEMDFATILEASTGLNPDFIIGNSKGVYLSRQLGIPLVRCGFPIHDRIGGHRILHLGYRGTLNLFERICNTLMETKQNAAPNGWTYI
jgi:nitrogenase molybdenum-iron protein NifN